MKLIELEDVWYRYPESDWVLQNVSLGIEEGEFVVVAGPSGSGKSTLCRVMIGIATRFYGGELRGKVRICGRDIDETTVPERIGMVGFVSQNPENQIATMIVEEEIAFPLENLGMEVNEIRDRVEWSLEVVSIKHLRKRCLYTLSSGELQRVVIASVLALKPRVVVLDEPLAHLDPKAVKDLLDLLRRLWREGVTIVIAEHRLTELLRYATRIVILDKRIIFDGDPRDAIARGVLQRIGVEIPPMARLLHRLSADYNDVDILDESTAIEILKNLDVECLCRDNDDRRGDVAVEIHDLFYRYPNGVEALRGVDLTLRLGEIVAIVGPNGSGKTTLVKHMNGLLKPQKGFVKVFGIDTRRAKVSTLSRYVAVVFQNPLHYFVAPSVLEELRFVAEKSGVKVGDREIMEILKVLRIDHLADRAPHTLSLGEQRRVVIASALIRGTPVVVLDEPTAGLDYDAKTRLANLLRSLRDRNRCIAIVTHDMEFVAKLKPDRLVVLVNGVKVYDGDPRRAMYNDDLMEKARLSAPQIPRLLKACGKCSLCGPLDEEELLSLIGAGQ